MAKQRVAFSLRLPVELHSALKAAADGSLHREIVERLERSLDEDKQLLQAVKENRELRESVQRLIGTLDKALDRK